VTHRHEPCTLRLRDSGHARRLAQILHAGLHDDHALQLEGADHG